MAAKPQGLGLWIGVAVVFGLMALAWTAIFVAAKHTPVQEIKIEKSAR
jgi:hypothetical protein